MVLVVVLAGQRLEVSALLFAGCKPTMLLQHADHGYHWPDQRPAPPCLHWSWPLPALAALAARQESPCLALLVVALQPAQAGDALGLPCLPQEEQLGRNIPPSYIEEELALVPFPPIVLVVTSMGERTLVVVACLLVVARLAHLLLLQQGIWEALGYAQQLETGLLLRLVCVCPAGQLWLRLVESMACIPGQRPTLDDIAKTWKQCIYVSCTQS